MDNNASPIKSIIKYKTFLSLPNKKKKYKTFPNETRAIISALT